jgi:hypothetical protein
LGVFPLKRRFAIFDGASLRRQKSQNVYFFFAIFASFCSTSSLSATLRKVRYEYISRHSIAAFAPDPGAAEPV